MKQLSTFLINELKLIARDTRALALLFLMPAILILVLSSILNHLYQNQKPQMRILIVSPHQSIIGDQLVNALGETNQEVKFLTEIPPKANKSFDLLIKIPESLPNLLRESSVPSTDKVEFVFYKFIDPFQKTFLMHEFVRVLQAQIIGEINHELKKQQPGVVIVADPSKLVVESTGDGARDFSPLSFSLSAWSLFAIFFIVVPFSNSFFRDWNNDILLRLKSMRISKSKILGGRILAYLIVNFAQFIFLLFLGLFVYPSLLHFQMELNPQSILPLFCVVLLSSLVATAYALFISCAARTQEQASAMGAFGVVIFSVIGGIMVPTIFMPEFMVKFISVCSPLYWALNAFAEALQKNLDGQAFANSLLILLAFAIMFFGVSLRLFNWEKK